MNSKEKMKLWLDMTSALVRDTFPLDKGINLEGLSKAEFASLTAREQRRVDSALKSICLAAGESEVMTIISSLHQDTQRALLARFATCYAVWKKLDQTEYHQLWHPPRTQDLWRAIFLAMIVDPEVQTTLRDRIQTAEFQSGFDSK